MAKNPVHRTAASLRNRNWPTFIIELMLIIIGILAALAIDGWATERGERKAETAYLQSLAGDLVLFESELQEQFEFEDWMIATGNRALEAINSDAPAEHAEEIGSMLTELVTRRTLFLESAVYTDLLSTGNLDLIRDSSLKNSIIRHFALTERRELIIEKNNSFFVDEIFGRFVQDFGVGYHRSNLPLAFGGANADIFSDAMLNMVDRVLLLPPDAPEWEELHRRIMWRTAISSSIRNQVNRLLESTVDLRRALEARVSSRHAADPEGT